jgi:hypothetical protein
VNKTQIIRNITPLVAAWIDGDARLCHSEAGLVLTYAECEEIEYRVRVRHDTPRQAVEHTLTGQP